MDILEDNDTNWLVLTPDGSTETKTKSSDLNKLLFGHDLYGLLDTGNEIWTHSGTEEEPSVTLIPGEDECYTIRLGDAPDLTIGAHHKTDLVDALSSMYEDHDGDSVGPILNLYDSIREDMMRTEALVPFADVFSDKVEKRDDGWFINGHLLLTYEGDFYHPSTDSRQRSGHSVIGAGSTAEAYSVSVSSPERSMSRNVTVDGEDYQLTDKEVKFLAQAMWAIENTPDRR